MNREWYTQTIAILRRPPADVYAIVGLLLAARFLPILGPGGVVRSVVALPLLLFLPGYALLTAVFPYASGPESEGRMQITVAERLALSFGLSVALSSLVAFALTLLAPGFGVGVAVDGISVVILVFTVLGAFRRLSLQPRHRFTLGVTRWASSVLETPDTFDRGALLSVLLVVSVLATFGTMGYVITQPLDGSAYTGFQIVTENASGEYVAAEYPGEMGPGEAADLTFAVRNSEGRDVRYTVVILYQTVDSDGAVRDSTVFERYQREVGAGETWHHPHEVVPLESADRSRFTYLLYEGEPPGTPTVDNAYRHLYLWIEGSQP